MSLIYLLDDDCLILKHLKHVLEDNGYQVEEYSDPIEFLRLREPSSPSCLLIDYQMPHLNGIQVQNLLKDRGWNLPTIFMSAYGAVSVAVTAMKQGGVDFIQKPLNMASVLSAVDRALELSRLQQKKRSEMEEAKEKLSKLTEREHDVLELLIRGQLNKQIASNLDICERTVKVHRSRILAKLGVDAVPLVVSIVMAAGLDPNSIR